MKKTFLFFVIIFAFFFSFESTAQKITPAQEKKVNDIYKSKKVVYFRFPIRSMQELPPLAKIISIDGNKGTMVLGHANKEQFKNFIIKNYPYTLMPAPKAKAKPKKK